MHLSEPTRGTMEFLRRRNDRNAQLKAFTKLLKIGERRAAIAAGKDLPLTDKQRLGK